MIKISKTSKMRVNGKAVKSFSLPAGSSCPGSKDAEVCKSCYAKSGFYHMPVVKSARKNNVSAYKEPSFVSDMIKIIKQDKYFRFFDSGDFETKLLAEKVYEICKACPNTTFWIPSRSDKIKSILPVLNKISKLPNVAMRFSADNIGFKKERKGVNSYVINVADIPEALARNISVCPVTLPGSTQKSCGTCTTCYTQASVAYVVH